MNGRRVTVGVLMLLTMTGAGCRASTLTEQPTVPGRRVQGTQVVAQGSMPHLVGAYELVFAERPEASSEARRAALLVDLVGGHGHVRGFVEWGRSEPPALYAVGGWARQVSVEGELLTVFEMTLHYLKRRAARDPRDPADLALRIVLNEASGDVTLIRRR